MPKARPALAFLISVHPIRVMRNPSPSSPLLMLVVADLTFSCAVAHLLAEGLGWRYLDPVGLYGQPFDAGNSTLVFSLYGVLGWPLIGVGVWAVIGEHSRRKRRIAVRSANAITL